MTEPREAEYIAAHVSERLAAGAPPDEIIEALMHSAFALAMTVERLPRAVSIFESYGAAKAISDERLDAIARAAPQGRA